MVSQVLDLIEAGKSFTEIHADYYPDLSPADIRACIRFAKELVLDEDIHVVEASRLG